MCAALSPAHHQLRLKILSEATKHAHITGFTNATLAASLKSVGAEDISDRTLARIFSRGFPIALVEHIVRSTNLHVQQELEAAFSKDAIIKSIDSNVHSFVQNQLLLPTEKNVAEKAILLKVEFLTPLVAHWPSAVALEYLPHNLPYTAINLAEFVDTTVYYMERVATLGELLEPARRILQSKAMVSRIPHEEVGCNGASQTSAFLNSFMKGISLSSGPYSSHSAFNFSWYYKRAQVMLLYGAVTTSLMGDVSRNAADTRSFAKAAVETLL
ncbi:hypothetical protein GH5_05626 [Leishmania sp. Ghana 2012 LV757]|uniref:hypothetical protein n=1 Tax=Leishmania sp. Ghana 2012 LV757 TaxID=2803181 RepID=UPI001B7C062D|nr:hypothetical protein GH5_05626 [Leishmania sp. Ghana 2012 LV757]